MGRKPIIREPLHGYLMLLWGRRSREDVNEFVHTNRLRVIILICMLLGIWKNNEISYQVKEYTQKQCSPNKNNILNKNQLNFGKT